MWLMEGEAHGGVVAGAAVAWMNELAATASMSPRAWNTGSTFIHSTPRQTEHDLLPHWLSYCKRKRDDEIDCRSFRV